MTVVLLVAVAFVTGLGLARVARRRLSDEGSSVRNYQHTIETLRHLSVQDRTSSPTKAEGSPPSRAPAPSLSAADAGNGAAGIGNAGKSNRGRRQGATKLLASSTPRQRRPPVLAARSSPAPVSMRVDAPFDETIEAPPPRPAPPADRLRPTRTTAAVAVRELAAARNLHGPRPARSRMPAPGPVNRGPVLLTAAAVLVIGAVTAVALALGPSHSPGKATAGGAHGAGPSEPATTAPTGKKTAPKTAAAHGSASGLAPVTSSATAATYLVPTAPYTVTMVADGACWAEAVSSATGQVLGVGTLEAGQSRTVSTQGGMVLRLGDARNVVVSVGGQVVHLPPGYQAVMSLTFQAA